MNLQSRARLAPEGHFQLRRRLKGTRPGAPTATKSKRRERTPSAETTAEDAVLSPPTAIDPDPLASEPARNTKGSGALHPTESNKENASHAFYRSVISEEQEKISQQQIALTPDEEQRAWRRALLPRAVERLDREREKAGEEAQQLSKKLQTADRQIERLNELVENQRQTMDHQQRELEKLQAPDTDRACVLTQIVHDIKSTIRRKGQKLTQAELTLIVDRWLERRGRDLKDVCPPGWLKKIEINKFPRLFSDCIKHPTLGGKAKTLMTRA